MQKTFLEVIYEIIYNIPIGLFCCIPTLIVGICFCSIMASSFDCNGCCNYQDCDLECKKEDNDDYDYEIQ